MGKIIVGVPTLNRYDLLANLVNSINDGTVVPNAIVIIDNGGQFKKWIQQTPSNLRLVNNGNLGVAGAWNKIINGITDEDCVVISNDDLEFEPDTLEKFYSATEEFVSCTCVSALNKFSLFKITKACVDKAGKFDEEFFPAYFEDNSYQRSMILSNVIEGTITSDVKHLGSQTIKSLNSIQLREHHANFEKNKAMYKAMWGGLVGEETYLTKFNR